MKLTAEVKAILCKHLNVPADAFDKYTPTIEAGVEVKDCLLYTSPSPRDS